MATTGNPHTPPRKPKRRSDAALANFGLGSDDEDFVTPPGVTRKVRPTTPLAPRSPNAATAPVYVGTARDLEQPEEEEEEEEEEQQRSDQPYASKKKRKKPCTRGGGGAWRQNHPVGEHAVDDHGAPLDFDAHFDGLEYFDVRGFDFGAVAKSVNKMEADWNNDPSESGTYYTHSGTKGLSSQSRGPPGGAASAFDNDGLRPLKTAIEGSGGRLGTYRFMPGDGSRVQDSHADGGVAEETRLLMTAHVRSGQESSSLNFHLRENPAEHPRKASLVLDKETGRAATRKFPKRHATCVIGDGVAFGRASGMVHEVVAAPAAPGGRSAGTLTILVDITWPEGATWEQRLQRQKDLARRLAAVGDVDPASPQYATGLHIPRKEEVNPANLSATNTAYNHCVVQLADGTTTTNASRNARTATVRGEKVTVSEAAWEGRAAPTPLEIEAMDQSSADSSRGGAAGSGVDCNQVGAGKNSNNAARLRLDIPGATKARGLCLGLDAQGDGLAEKLATWIDTDTGAIREGAPLCGRPKFGKDGYLTRGKGEWKQDGKGYLVLGVHNSNGKPTNPWCGIGGTVPVVLVGGEWRVAKWGLPFIKARKVVQRNTDNQRHGRVPKKAKT